jgi:hypothetical protein
MTALPPMPPTPDVPEPEPSQAATQRTAAAALLLALLVCIPFVTALAAIVLAVRVIVTSRGGIDRGRRLAYGAIVVAVVALMAWGSLVAAFTMIDLEDLRPVENLRPGQCVDLDPVIVVDCARPHDAEVLATKVLTQDDARDYDPDGPLCDELLSGVGDREVVALTTSEDPNAGDLLACVGTD